MLGDGPRMQEEGASTRASQWPGGGPWAKPAKSLTIPAKSAQVTARLAKISGHLPFFSSSIYTPGLRLALARTTRSRTKLPGPAWPRCVALMRGHSALQK